MKRILAALGIFYSISLSAQPYFEWANGFGDTAGDIGYAITTDASGNVYATGDFSGTVDFDPGSGVYNLTSVGGFDIFISKYDASGNFIWAKQIGGTTGDAGYSIAVDASENVYTTGFFYGTVDFDPGAGVFNLTAAGNDIFICKLDASGNFVWAKQIGGSSGDTGHGIANDASGNLYIAGTFYGTADFDPGAGVFNMTSAGGNDIFVCKLDTSGNFLWARQLGGTLSDSGFSTTTDASGNVLTTGYFQGTADFDPGAGVFNLTSAGSQDIFICKLDASGNFLWASRAGDSAMDQGLSIATDALGNVFTTGYFEGTADFDPGAGTFNLTSTGGSDIFISKLDASGNFLWAGHTGGSGNDDGFAVATDATGNVYFTGVFGGTVDFDPGPGTYNMTSVGSSDIFITKLDNFSWAVQIGGSVGYAITTDVSGNVITTGYYSSTGDFNPESGVYNLVSAGSSDIFVVKLSQCTSSSAAISASVCSSYTVPSGDETYSASGAYMDTIPNATGCDSVITINLTITGPTTNTITETTCDTYTVPSGHETYSVSGTYMDTIPNATGCDSVITINLTVGAVDVGITVSGVTLTANATGATYQWVDCNDSYAPVSGETNQDFTPTANGNYAVIVTDGSCSDTSACQVVTEVGIGEGYSKSAIHLFPNPTAGSVTIELDQDADWAEITIFELSGKFIDSFQFENCKVLNVTLGERTGVYIIQLITSAGTEHLQVVKL